MSEKNKILKVNFGPISDKTVELLKVLNLALLPVQYNKWFYQKVINYQKYSRYAFFNDIVVGGIVCREELKDNEKTLYMLTFGVLKDYRKFSIGTQIINELFRMAKEDPEIKSIYLHVQISNETAINFYKNCGFEVIEKIENYYQDIDPPHCFYLKKYLA